MDVAATSLTSLTSQRPTKNRQGFLRAERCPEAIKISEGHKDMAKSWRCRMDVAATSLTSLTSQRPTKNRQGFLRAGRCP